MALEIFKEFGGDKINTMPFAHSVDEYQSDVYYLDVTNCSIKKLNDCVDDLLDLYKKSGLA